MSVRQSLKWTLSLDHISHYHPNKSQFFKLCYGRSFVFRNSTWSTIQECKEAPRSVYL
ncbi:hypothetical protein M408DRAFT_122274 [Serendipita vermifera MAFF 305830]|uniref:Uncharacterized protein n=1 Tax=Serendipita vermifera MAFF 305830 TaxID=933852 RepID=A0A0C3BCZ0_SERVB|nr:hypothetical protein M408DRAFT_122274 [Serendipita vermifera MAFF 305830]